MASRVSIANEALIKLGVSTITSLTENSEQARLVNNIFSESLDYLLERYPWSFAKEQSSLARLDETPLYDYTYVYQLPTDPFCLHVVEVEDDYPFMKKGNTLYSDQSAMNITYIKRITSMLDLSPLFRSAFSFYLASQLAMPLVNDREVATLMKDEFNIAFLIARLMDAKNDPHKARSKVSWISRR